MTETFKLFNIVIESSGVVFCGMAILLVLYGPKIERKIRGYFLWYFSGCIVLSAANIAGLIMRGLPGKGWHAALYVSNYTEFLIPTALAYLITHYLMSIVDAEKEKKPLRLGMLALLTVSQFTGLYYVIGPDNIYRRQPLYPICFICTLLILVNDLVIVFKYRRRFTRKEFAVFMIYFTVPAAAMILQALQYGVNFTIFSTIIAGLAMYLFIVRDQTERYENEQRENAKQRASIMVLEMRPHFICNTMMSIYYLCDQDPKKAQQVTLDFTEYLRRNFTAITKEGTIPFAEELEHTRAYLAVEKARFEDQLFVEFDTPCTLFRIPPLTLQPIVENAVKHGLSPELWPLRISVATRETDGGSEVIVEDNGPGFAPSDDDEPHIALANIRERLNMMGGRMLIEQRAEGGTRVTVRVPVRTGEQR
ncbi:MAG: histidine kinase [Clostridia bacterium]|nr:histidine kinase [Clostridia bacterium]